MKVLEMFFDTCSGCPLYISEYLTRDGSKYGYRYSSVCSHDDIMMVLDPNEIHSKVSDDCKLKDA